MEDAGLLFAEADVICTVTEGGDGETQLCPKGTCLSTVTKGQRGHPPPFRFGPTSDVADYGRLPCAGCFNGEHICDCDSDALYFFFIFLFGSSIAFSIF